MDAELRVRTCRLIEQMRRQPEHACRLGLEDVSVFRAKQAKAPQVRAVMERERRGSARKAAAAKGITPV